jgi:large subunit ribosomal protein L17
LHQEEAVKILFNEIAPAQKDRPGGYTRIVRLGQRQGDSGQVAILEWVDMPLAVEPAAPESSPEKKSAEKETKGEEKKAEATA